MKLIIATPSPFARKARIALIVTERSRAEGKQSADWIARQARKMPAALKELERLLGAAPAFTPDGFGLAEIATGCTLGYLDLRYPELDWRAEHPNLDALARALELRPSFAATRPAPQAVAIGG